MAVRLLHFSDLHIPPRRLRWQLNDLLSKSLSGWVNVRVLGRARRFKHAEVIIARLLKLIDRTQPDGVLFSGDATHLAFDGEFEQAAQLLEVAQRCGDAPAYVAVPGNHDYYTRHAVKQGRFEQHFGPWQAGLRLGQEPYPFARNIKGVWVLAVCSCTANTVPMDATGAIGPAQLERLRRLAQQLGPGRRILLTHYPLRALSGQPEHRLRRLRDHQQALQVAQDIGVSLWLHGHIHTPFYLPSSEQLPFPTIGNGSTAQNQRWSLHEYHLSDDHLAAVRYRFNVATSEFEEVLRFELPLRAVELTV